MCQAAAPGADTRSHHTRVEDSEDWEDAGDEEGAEDADRDADGSGESESATGSEDTSTRKKTPPSPRGTKAAAKPAANAKKPPAKKANK